MQRLEQPVEELELVLLVSDVEGVVELELPPPLDRHRALVLDPRSRRQVLEAACVPLADREREAVPEPGLYRALDHIIESTPLDLTNEALRQQPAPARRLD